MNKPRPITAEQITRFFEGRCAPEEAEAVSKYLQENEEVLRQYIHSDWKEAEVGPALPVGYSKEMFEAIQEETGVLRKGRVAVMGRRMMSVAAAVFLLAVGVWLLWPAKRAEVVKGEAPAPAAPAKLATVQPIRTIHSKGEEKVQLPDGSTIVLYANSTLRYPEPFDTNSRALSLEGAALFTVAKDEARPFVVTAGELETTVLGTEFSVEESRGAVQVRLYSGKVRLHAKDLKWKKDVVLAPGEQLDYTAKNALAVVSRWDMEQEELEATEPVVEQELVFDNEALPQVMDKLSSCYHLNIAYNRKQIGNMYFTGTVLTSDSLTTILHVIANMNELTIVPGKKGYTIRKQAP